MKKETSLLCMTAMNDSNSGIQQVVRTATNYSYRQKKKIILNDKWPDTETRLKHILPAIQRLKKSIYEFDKLYNFFLRELTYPDIEGDDYSYHRSLKKTQENYAEIFMAVRKKLWTPHRLMVPYYNRFADSFMRDIENALEYLTSAEIISEEFIYVRS